MRVTTLAYVASALLLLPIAAFPQIRIAAQVASTASAAPCLNEKIAEEAFVPIGGIEQWITIHGEHCDNPVVLFIHGGPGNPLSPFAENVYGDWQSEFTLVQWDQRGAGRTFGRNPATADSPLTVERMTQDGIDLATYLTAHLQQKKIILAGSSWGSVLAVHMAKARPDLFQAYLGTSQLVNGAENQAATYQKLLALARDAGDAATTTTLEALRPPPWANPRNAGILRRATRKYEAKTTIPAPDNWWVPAPAYATQQAQKEAEASDDYSYIQYVGMDGHGIFASIDLPGLGVDFGIPVFLVQGAEDLVTVPEISRRYFDTLTAPQKAYVLVASTGHDPNAAMVDAQYDLLKTRIMPLTKETPP